MAAKSILKNGVVAALAAAIAATAVPASASAQEDRRENRGGWGSGAQRSGAQAQQRSPERQQAPQQRVEAPRAQPQAQAQPSWQGRGNGSVQQGTPRRDGNWTGNQGRPNPGNGAVVARPDRNGTPSWQNNDRNRDQNRERNRNGGWNTDRNGQGTPSWRNNDRDRNGDWNRNRDWNRDRNNNWNRDRNGGWNRNDNRGWGQGNSNYRRWNNDWRRDNRYNWSSWRNQHRDHYRGGYYSAPYRGYNYSRLSIGIFLGSPFYQERYWISDPGSYRLPDAYGPYRWVRYYDDVLLIDTYSGEVVDVIYDFFW